MLQCSKSAASAQENQMLKITPFVDASKASVDSLSGMSAQALQGAEQLSALNLQVTKTMLAEATAFSQAVLSAKSPAELGKVQTAALQAAPQKALAYGLQVKDIFAAATLSQNSAVEAQVADLQAKFLEGIQGALKNAPGSEQTLALVNSAVAAANNARAGVNQASKQLSDALAANVQKITEAAAATSRGSLATT